MDNYYKTSKNIGNILNSYEFQRQFVKSKRKYKFMKKIRQKKLSLEKSSSGFNTLTSNDTNKNIIETKLNTDNEIKSQAKKSLTYTNHLKNNMSTIKEEETPNNNDYDISTILAKNKPKREKTSQYMRQTLFQQIKNEGLYDESEEENVDICQKCNKKNKICVFKNGEELYNYLTSKNSGMNEDTKKLLEEKFKTVKFNQVPKRMKIYFFYVKKSLL